jgi:tRNA threonylcarbamoyladenosine biosynthesis protein TsaB
MKDDGPWTSLNLLALDTSTERAAIALATATGLYLAVTDAARRHGRDLIPRLGALLTEAGLGAGDLDVVAVGLGPGSYTGLRVGVTAAKTLAYATGATLLGLDSLEVVGRNAPAQAMRVSVVADAQRNEVYVADFVREEPGHPLALSRDSHVELLSAWLAGLEPGVLVLGPGLTSARIRAAVPAGFVTPDPAWNYPEGSRLIASARAVWASGRRENHWLVEPRYLRRSAAEEQWDARRRPQPAADEVHPPVPE